MIKYIEDGRFAILKDHYIRFSNTRTKICELKILSIKRIKKLFTLLSNSLNLREVAGINVYSKILSLPSYATYKEYGKTTFKKDASIKGVDEALDVSDFGFDTIKMIDNFMLELTDLALKTPLSLDEKNYLVSLLTEWLDSISFTLNKKLPKEREKELIYAKEMKEKIENYLSQLSVTVGASIVNY